MLGELFEAALNSMVLLFCAIFILYVLLILVPFLRRRPAAAGDEGAFGWNFIGPCLDRLSADLDRDPLVDGRAVSTMPCMLRFAPTTAASKVVPGHLRFPTSSTASEQRSSTHAEA